MPYTGWLAECNTVPCALPRSVHLLWATWLLPSAQTPEPVLGISGPICLVGDHRVPGWAGLWHSEHWIVVECGTWVGLG